MEPLITATQDDGIIEGDGQRGVITSIIDATPTPDLKPGGANSQQLKQSVAAATGEDSSQRLSQPTGATHRPLPLLQLRRLMNGQPSPATCLILKDARDYYANYNAAPRAFPPRPSPKIHVSHTATPSGPDRPSEVVEESPSPPPVDNYSVNNVGLQHHPLSSESQAVWSRSHQGSQNPRNIATGHGALLPKSRGNDANFTGPAPVPMEPGPPYNTSNAPHPSFYQMPLGDEQLPSFAELEAKADWYTRERITAASSIANDRSGTLNGLVIRRDRQDAADRTMLDEFLPRTIHREHGNVSATSYPVLLRHRLSQDAPSLTQYIRGREDFANDYPVGYYGVAHTRGGLRMRPNPSSTQQSYGNVAGLMQSAPVRADIESRANRGRIPDEQALEILESNPTIAEEFRRACATRLQQYQQTLDRAYNQRLAEMEQYTQEWRNSTGELWQAFRAGQFQAADMSKQSCLAWQGPQEMAKSGRYRLAFVEICVEQPIFLENGQAHDDIVSPHMPSAAFSAAVAPTAPQRMLREVRLDNRQLHQNGTRSQPSGTSKSNDSRSYYTQTSPVSSAAPEQLLESRPALGQLILSQPDTFRNARHRATTCPPDLRGGSASAETEVRQPSYNQPAPNKSNLLQPDPIPTEAVRPPLRQLSALEWISNLDGYVQEPSGQYSSKSKRLLSILCSSSLGSSFTFSPKPSYSAILLGVKSKSPGFHHRKFENLQSSRNIVHPSEVVIDLSAANALMFGRAFCYMKQRIDHLRSLLGLTSGSSFANNEHSQRMYYFFSQQPINRALNTVRHPENKRTGMPCRDPVHETRKLLIVRPRHEDGHVTGAAYLDVGSEQPVIRADRDNSIILMEDSITFERLVAMLDWCLKLHVVVLPGVPRPEGPNKATTTSKEPRDGASQRTMTLSEPRVRWDRWVKVVQGSPSAYLRIEVDNSKYSFKMGSYKCPVIPKMADHLRIPRNRQIWFRCTVAQGEARFWNLESARLVTNPMVAGQDVMIQWTAGNVLMFWKAFCLLKERMDALAILRAQEAEVSVDVDSPSSHERLARYYRDFLARKDRQTKLCTISLPVTGHVKKGDPTFDSRSRGCDVDRTLLIVRVYPKDKTIEGFLRKYLDVDTVTALRNMPNLPGDIIIPEHNAVASHIASLLISSIHMNMFPSLDGLGRPLYLQNLQEQAIMQSATLSGKPDDSAKSIASLEGLGQVDVSNLPDTPAARNTRATQDAAMTKRNPDLSTNARDHGSSGSSETSKSQEVVALAIHTELSTSLNAAAANPSVHADSIHTQEPTRIDGSQGKSSHLGDIIAPSDKLPTTSSKRPAPDADARFERPPKRIRLAILGNGTPEVANQSMSLSELARNNSPAQQQQNAQAPPYSTPLGIGIAPAMPEKVVMPPAFIGEDNDCPTNPSVLGDQCPENHIISQLLDLPQEEILRAAEDAAIVPAIVHRHTLEPEITTVLPFTEYVQVQRAYSAEALEAWQVREDMAAPSDSGSEAAESSYVTAAEMSDE